MQMETATFLVREKGFDGKAFRIQATRFLSIVQPYVDGGSCLPPARLLITTLKMFQKC